MTTVSIPRRLVNQILDQAQRSPLAEVCGLIGGRNGRPLRCYPIVNADPHPEHHFLMEPHQQIAAMREMRERGEGLFAIYHSHPDTPPLPSAEDLAQAAYPEALYLIVSLATVGTLQMRGFEFKGGRVNAVDFEVDETSTPNLGD
jgi:proteasome lid subunit RPN8/RPN11